VSRSPLGQVIMRRLASMRSVAKVVGFRIGGVFDRIASKEACLEVLDSLVSSSGGG
jgi:hypothetical protein